jgi:hypothetical protein
VDLSNAINHVTFTVPSRQFVITSSVTVNESLPKVTEFVLRLVRLCEAIEPEDIGSYFGFSEKETRLILESLGDQSLIRFDGNLVRLTDYADSKFYTDDDLPRFSVVKPRTDHVDFDLLTFHPIDGRSRNKAPGFAVQLTVNDEQTSSSTRLAEQAYQRHFQRILRVKEKGNDKIDIYKISSVQSKQLFDIPVDVSFNLDVNSEVERIIAYDEDAPEPYRLEVESSVSDALKRPLSNQYLWLADFVDIFDDKVLAQYLSKKGFDFSRYVQEVHIERKVGYSQMTQPVFGNMYMPVNAQKILDAVQMAVESTDAEVSTPLLTSVAWLAPDYKFWGRTGLFEDFYFKLQERIPRPKKEKKDFGERVELLYPGTEDIVWALQQQLKSKREKSVHFYSGQVMGGRIEVLLVPTRLVCVLFHYALPGNSSALVPIGFLSTDPRIIKIARGQLRESLDGGRKYICKARFSGSSTSSDKDFNEHFGFTNYDDWPVRVDR